MILTADFEALKRINDGVLAGCLEMPLTRLRLFVSGLIDSADTDCRLTEAGQELVES